MRRLGALLAVAALALGPVACGLDDDETEGDLGRGAFRYVCFDESDHTCEGGEATTFPDQVATGSRFALEVRDLEWGDDLFGARVVTASEKFIAPVPTSSPAQAFEARMPGTVAMLAMRFEDDAIGDFTHMVVADVERIELSCDRVSLHVGESMTCMADASLAGALEFAWTTPDAAALSVVPESGTARAEVTARKLGTARLVAEVGDVRGELDVLVEPKPADGGGSPGVTDASTDSDAGVDDDAG